MPGVVAEKPEGKLMKRAGSTLLALLFIFAGTPLLEAEAGEYLISAAASDLNGILARHKMALKEVVGPGVFQVTVSPTVSIVLFATELSADKKISRFERDCRVSDGNVQAVGKVAASASQIANVMADKTVVNYYGATVPAPYANQQAAGLVHLPQALGRFGAGNTIVAVIDTGIDPTHPALKGVLVPGYDFTRNIAGFASEMPDLQQSTVAILEQSTVAILESKRAVQLNQSTVAILEQSTVAILESKPLPSDFGHGTMVAGLIHFVAPGVRIMPLKAFHSDGTSNLSDIVRAIYYAVDHQARVINMSFSAKTASPALADALQYAWSHGVICVASAGNDGRQMKVYPAGSYGTIGVGSTTMTDRRSTFSNYGTDSVKTSAPGEGLITTFPGNHYAGVWGTSFSSALVSGAIALMYEISPKLSAPKVYDALDHGRRVELGMGDARLDLWSSLLYLLLSH